MRREVGDINGIDIKFLMARGSVLGSFNPLKLPSELLYLLSESNNGIIPPYFMSLLK